VLEFGVTHQSLAALSEADLVKKSLAGGHREHMLRLCGIPEDVRDFQRVLLDKDTGCAGGDIDILVFPDGRPELSTAIETKRIKVGSKALRTGRPNKLHELENGVRQANQLAALGFWRVYLYIFVVVDSRELNSGKISYAGLSMELKSLIHRNVSACLKKLRKRIGLYKCEFVQPMDYAPLGVGSFSGHLIRNAESVDQPLERTRWVEGATRAIQADTSTASPANCV
jgi:hypothetical protein